MKIVHARKQIFNKDHAFQHKMSLLVWILSILKWRQYGNEVILYADKATLSAIKEIGFDHLYNHINTEVMEKEYKNLDFHSYWAMPKLIALEHEKLILDNDCVIADQDVVPMQDLKRFWTNTEVAVWSNKEYTEIRATYPMLNLLSTPEKYKFPEWFTGNAKPLNTGVIHIKDKNIVDLYIKEAFRLALNNKNDKDNTICQTMCNAEQRLLGEIVEYKNLSYGVVQPINATLFNKNGFHTHGYKNKINNTTGLLWHLNLLLMIKELDSAMFDKLIANPKFAEEKLYFETKGYTCPATKELKQYNFSFNIE